jgi:hypothetical protein
VATIANRRKATSMARRYRRSMTNSQYRGKYRTIFDLNLFIRHDLS